MRVTAGLAVFTLLGCDRLFGIQRFHKDVDAPAVATGWNPADKTSNITLSNGDANAFDSANVQDGVRGVSSKASGRWYAEFQAVNIAGDHFAVGFANAAWQAANVLVGLDSNGVSYSATTGHVLAMNAPYGILDTIVTAGTGSTIELAVDLDDQLVWFRIDSGMWNMRPAADPSSLAGGYSYAGYATGTVFLAFGTSALGNVVTLVPAPDTIPAGFALWQ